MANWIKATAFTALALLFIGSPVVVGGIIGGHIGAVYGIAVLASIVLFVICVRSAYDQLYGGPQ